MAAMSHRRRPRHHMYDYNYKVGESSYQDMLEYLDRKEGRRAASPPPGKKSFAERFAEKPIYGEPRSLQLGSTLLAAELEPAVPRRPRPVVDIDDTFLAPRPRPTLDDPALDMDPDELIASLRRGRCVGTDDAAEDLGTRTRRALREIDDEFAAMGLYSKSSVGSGAASALVTAETDATAGASCCQKVSSSSNSSSVSKKAASSAAKRVTYTE